MCTLLFAGASVAYIPRSGITFLIDSSSKKQSGEERPKWRGEAKLNLEGFRVALGLVAVVVGVVAVVGI